MATITVTELSSFAIAPQKNVNGGDTGNPEQGGDAPAQTGDSRNIWIWVIAFGGGPLRSKDWGFMLEKGEKFTVIDRRQTKSGSADN